MKKVKTLAELQKILRNAGVLLATNVTREAAPAIVKAFKDTYPPQHVRTGALRAHITFAPFNATTMRFYSGVRKKLSRTGKRRARRTTAPNYGQFQDFLFKDTELVERVLKQVLDREGS